MRRGFASPSFDNRAHQLAIATIAVSIVQGFLLQSGTYVFLFSPFKTLHYLELWRPFTALFVAASPVEVIFGALIIYSIGGMLESRLSRRRFTYTVLGIPLIAELVVVALSFIAPSLVPSSMVYAGSRQVISTLWILYGLASHFSRERLNFWGTPITGKTFALIGVGFVFLSGVFGGFIPVLPDVITVALCYLYMYRYTVLSFTRKYELSYYDWKLKRLKQKSGFKVIKGSRSDDDPGHQIH